jgi:serine/threonine protein kinase
MLQAEQVLHKRYQLQQKLGHNPWRQTWLAADVGESSASKVIVKLLAFNPQMHWDELKLFEREAQVLAHLNHPRIPKYRNYFSVDPQTGAGLPWFGLVQQYINGESLQQLLNQGKRFTEKQVQQIATSILEILIYLHELSPPVFHRDIKPSNLILGKDGQVYLVDFGAVQDRATAEGATFTVVGTSGYAPPEQLWGRAVPASDLYALGATLIHLLTGTAPADLPQRQMRILFADRVRLSPSFAQWLEKLTAPAPERRFSTARQALHALQAGRNSSSPTEKGDRSSSRSVRYGRLAGLASLQLLVIGVGAAIVLPTSLMPPIQPMKAKQAEAKNNITAMNRAQYAYHLEKKTFSDSFLWLEMGIQPQTENYEYSTYADAWGVFNYGVSRKGNLKSYVGGVFVPIEGNRSQIQDGSGLLVIECEANFPGTKRPAAPIYENGELVCGPGTTKLYTRMKDEG